MNSFITGEYPLYPPFTSVRALGREGYCTNDINAIRTSVEPDVVVKPDVVLLAQMTLEVSIGLVGCTLRQQSQCFSRMFCLISDSEAIISLLRYITTINEDIAKTEKRDEMLTGFAVDTGNVAVLFLEGLKDGHILHVWDMTEDFYPNVKPYFSCSAKYSSRIYPGIYIPHQNIIHSWLFIIFVFFFILVFIHRFACSSNAFHCIEDVCAFRSAFGMSICLCASDSTYAY